MKSRPVTVKLDESTYRWLSELAKANSHTELNAGTVTPEKLLAQAAICMADHAGRRKGSWEAEAGAGVLMPSGYQGRIGFLKQEQLHAREQRQRRTSAAMACTVGIERHWTPDEERTRRHHWHSYFLALRKGNSHQAKLQRTLAGILEKNKAELMRAVALLCLSTLLFGCATRKVAAPLGADPAGELNAGRVQ